MKVLVTYDIRTADGDGPRRLRRVARACEDYGQRVQKSVFECVVGDKEWAELKARLLDVIDKADDSLRFYFLDNDCRVEHVGTNKPIDLAGPLVI